MSQQLLELHTLIRENTKYHEIYVFHQNWTRISDIVYSQWILLVFSIQTKLQSQKSLTESSGWNRCKKIVIFLMRNSKKKKMIKALDQLFTANYALGYHDHYNPFTSCYSTLHYFCSPLWSLPFYLPDTPPFSSCQTVCFIPLLKDFLFLLCVLPVSCHPYLPSLQRHQSSSFHA